MAKGLLHSPFATTELFYITAGGSLDVPSAPLVGRSE